MAYRYVDWYGMARARGYEDPVKMAKWLVERHEGEYYEEEGD